MLILSFCHHITVKPLNKGRPRERQWMVFIDKWSLFEAYIGIGLLKCSLYLQGGLYLEVAFNTDLTVYEAVNSSGDACFYH